MNHRRRRRRINVVLERMREPWSVYLGRVYRGFSFGTKARLVALHGRESILSRDAWQALVRRVARQ